MIDPDDLIQIEKLIRYKTALTKGYYIVFRTRETKHHAQIESAKGPITDYEQTDYIYTNVMTSRLTESEFQEAMTQLSATKTKTKDVTGRGKHAFRAMEMIAAGEFDTRLRAILRHASHIKRNKEYLSKLLTG